MIARRLNEAAAAEAAAAAAAAAASSDSGFSVGAAPFYSPQRPSSSNQPLRDSLARRTLSFTGAPLQVQAAMGAAAAAAGGGSAAAAGASPHGERRSSGGADSPLGSPIARRWSHEARDGTLSSPGSPGGYQSSAYRALDPSGFRRASDSQRSMPGSPLQPSMPDSWSGQGSLTGMKGSGNYALESSMELSGYGSGAESAVNAAAALPVAGSPSAAAGAASPSRLSSSGGYERASFGEGASQRPMLSQPQQQPPQQLQYSSSSSGGGGAPPAPSILAPSGYAAQHQQQQQQQQQQQPQQQSPSPVLLRRPSADGLARVSSPLKPPTPSQRQHAEAIATAAAPAVTPGGVSAVRPSTASASASGRPATAASAQQPAATSAGGAPASAPAAAKDGSGSTEKASKDVSLPGYDVGKVIGKWSNSWLDSDVSVSRPMFIAAFRVAFRPPAAASCAATSCCGRASAHAPVAWFQRVCRAPAWAVQVRVDSARSARACTT
jgi:hypothetical protein